MTVTDPDDPRALSAADIVEAFHDVAKDQARHVVNALERPSTMILNVPAEVTFPAGAWTKAELWRCPTGRIAMLHRTVITAAGATPGSPLVGSAANWVVTTVGEPAGSDYPGGLVDVFGGLNGAGAANTNPVAPVVLSEGRDSCRYARNGESIWISGQLSVTTTLRFRLQIAVEDLGHSQYR